MKFGILYKPTNEYLALYDEEGNEILFVDDENDAKLALVDVLVSDGGYDGPASDFLIEDVDTETDGSEYLTGGIDFVKKSLIK